MGPRKIDVPCRHCWQCRRNRVNDFTGRALAEASVSDWTATLTLTYKEGLSAEMIFPPDAQAFIRSLRKRGHKTRYFICGEYGETKGRAHFHTVLFGKGQRPDWTQGKRVHIPAWPHGFVYVDHNADFRSIRYCMKYLLKGDSIDDRWFSMSKKPPLGSEWFARKARQAAELRVLPYTFEYQPPGAPTNQKFLMTGATRRDYLLELFEHWPQDRQSLKMATEWVAHVFQKSLKYRAERQSRDLTLDEFLESFADELQRGRLTPEQAERIVLRSQMRVLYDVQT